MVQQRRLIDFGATVKAKQISELVANISSPGLLTEDIFTIENGNVIRMKPFSVVMPSGIVIEILESSTISIPLITSAKKYTLTVRHVQADESGGVNATIELVDNLHSLYSLADRVILTWIEYPGNSVVLNDSMLTPPVSIKVTDKSSVTKLTHSVTAPLVPKSFQEVTNQPSTYVTNSFDGIRVYDEFVNSSPAINTHANYYFSMVASEKQPKLIFVNARVDYQAAIIISLITESGTEIFPTQNTISNTDWGIFGMELPNLRGVPAFKPYENFTVKLRMSLNPSKTISIASISLSDYNYPIENLRGSGSITNYVYPYTFVRLASVVDYYNPASGLPVSPAYGVRYISSSNANGWIKDSIYEYDSTDTWVVHTPTEGEIVRISNINADFVYNGYRWANDVPSHLILVP